MLIIEDESHCETQGEYPDFKRSLEELRRRAKIPWDQEPNRAPCTSWRTCGRRYQVIEGNETTSGWKELRRIIIVEISAEGIKWEGDFEKSE